MRLLYAVGLFVFQGFFVRSLPKKRFFKEKYTQ